MAVRHEDAEEYELPPLRSSLDGSTLDEDERLDDIDEQIRLLDRDGSAKPRGSIGSDGEESRWTSLGRDSPQGGLNPAGEEIKGEGSNIEALIARVGLAELTALADNHAARLISTDRSLDRRS